MGQFNSKGFPGFQGLQGHPVSNIKQNLNCLTITHMVHWYIDPLFFLQVTQQKTDEEGCIRSDVRPIALEETDTPHHVKVHFVQVIGNLE